ncbi:NACHT, LRR and PYD domains-containing protein 12-like isoform X1 [Pygocentrus nattereri]|nr:NACHT, LRR and PYD domains-containing protein 12-like isoform X1 [Pygocentrus nattereri]
MKETPFTMTSSPHILISALDELINDDLKRFTYFLTSCPPEGYPHIPRAELHEKSRTEVAMAMNRFYSGNALNVAVDILKKMYQNELVHNILRQVQEQRTNPDLTGKDLQSVVRNHKLWLKNKNKFIVEKTAYSSKKISLTDIYTDLTVTEGDGRGLNKEHEVLNIENSQPSHETRINCNDIFRGNEEIRTVLTKGVAGIGKTVSVQKFILDWAENKANEDIVFLFVLPFRELNLIKEECCSLHELLVRLHPELEGCNSNLYVDKKILFIFDGLEESRIHMNFRQTEIVSNVDIKSTVDSLIINLISKELLPSAHIWITSRPAAANLVPFKYIDHVTEIQGFNDLQKEEYFKKRVKNKDQFDRIISHIRSARTLHIMCEIPVFCWISVTALQPWLSQKCKKEIPTTLTEMYSYFLLIQTNTKNQKLDETHEEDAKKLLEDNKEMILKLSELAFIQLLKGNVMFYESDLEEFGIDVKEASWYSGLCTETYKVEFEFYKEKVYCFVHLSFQEFFAALYVFYCYHCKNLEKIKMFLPKTKAAETPLEVFMKNAVNEALKSKTGHLDLFLRFLHGITLESSQRLLKGLLTHIHSNPESIQKITKNLKQGQKKNINPERWINLSHCLIEMKDNSLQQEVQAFLKSKKKSKKLSLAHCSAMANIFQASEEVMDVLDLKKYNTSEEGHRRLIPAVRNCKKAFLSDCNLTKDSCENVASAMQSANSILRELDLSNNDLQDSGMELLCNGLKCSHCKLEILSLSNCKLTELSCKDIASALHSGNSSLRKLDLSYNDLQDKGVKLLSAGLKNPHCKLEILRLLDCRLTGKSCRDIASALQAAESSLRDLDLSCNDLQDSGIKQISVGLKSSHCNLKVLRLSDCKLTEQSCKHVASVVQKADSSLKELDLSNNDLKDSGVALLSDGLKSSNCSLEILRLSGCCITKNGCSSIASALHSNPKHLRELDLSYNYPGDSGVDLLVSESTNPTYTLDTIKMDQRGELRMAPGLKKYACKLTLDLKTANVRLALSDDNKKITLVEEDQPYPNDKQRFKHMAQVLCMESLSERCYWEAEWTEGAVIAVAYKGISKKGSQNDCLFGRSKKSWSLNMSNQSCVVWHNKKCIRIIPPSFPLPSRVGVLLDWLAGTLSFYSVSSNKWSSLHTFHATFTESLYAGFGLETPGSSVCLCNM